MIHPLFRGHACEHEYINGINIVGVCTVASHNRLTVTRLGVKNEKNCIIQQQRGAGRNMDGLITAIFYSLEICPWILKNHFIASTFFVPSWCFQYFWMGGCKSCNPSHLFFSHHVLEQSSLFHGTTSNFIWFVLSFLLSKVLLVDYRKTETFGFD